MYISPSFLICSCSGFSLSVFLRHKEQLPVHIYFSAHRNKAAQIQLTSIIARYSYSEKHKKRKKTGSGDFSV